eukprot:gene2145-299_t
MWVCRPDLRGRLTEVWQRRGAAGSEARPADYVAGPVGCVLDALGKLGWTWPAPQRLCTADGEELDLETVQEGKLLHEVREAARRWQWREAAKRRPRDMGGIEAGIDRVATLSLLGGLGSWRGFEQAVLRCILAGGQWSTDRLWRCGVVDDD